MGNDISAVSTPPTATQTTEAVTGSHQLKIAEYSRTKGLGVGKHISSAPFSVAGRSWAIQFYRDSDSDSDSATKDHKPCISLGLTLLSGLRTTQTHFNFTLQEYWRENEVPSPLDVSNAVSKSSSEDFSPGDVRVVKFMKRELFEASGHLKGDAFTIQCTVTVMEYPGSTVLWGNNDNNEIARLITVPPCNLRQQLRHFLASGLGVDVTFQVDAQKFHAHRCVLAASSPVFRAQLFGSMKEKEKGMDAIRIEEMEALVFRTMLNFIYTDTIGVGDVDVDDPSWMHHRLLVAADRFELDRLRSTCEFLLCRDLDCNNVSETLVLAERHNCGQLVVACLTYMASREVLSAEIDMSWQRTGSGIWRAAVGSWRRR